jgi:hypothetical protein
VSAAEILAKYAGDSYLDDDDLNDEPEQSEPSAPATPAVAAEPPTAPAGNPTGGDDDSIRDYMDQLMRRVRGQSDDAPTSAAHDASKSNAAAQQSAEPAPQPAAEPSQSACEVLTSDQYTPRSAAPERTDNLSKMRELANTSARSAIHQASKMRRAQSAVIRFVMAAAAAAAGVTLLGFISSGSALVRYPTAIIAFAAAVWWGYCAVCSALGREALPSRSLRENLNRNLQRKQTAQPANDPGLEVEANDASVNAEDLG